MTLHVQAAPAIPVPTEDLRGQSAWEQGQSAELSLSQRLAYRTTSADSQLACVLYDLHWQLQLAPDVIAIFQCLLVLMGT